MVLQSLLDFLKGLGASRLMAMVAVTAALIGFFAFVIMRVTTPQMTTLFTDLSIENSSAIIKDLDRQAIPYELRNDGTIIMVPKDKVTRLRMKLAEGGLPKGGGVGYEIFDKSDALGTTSFVQNINHLRALEGELARTIRAIDQQAVDGADGAGASPSKWLMFWTKLVVPRASDLSKNFLVADAAALGKPPSASFMRSRVTLSLGTMMMAVVAQLVGNRLGIEFLIMAEDAFDAAVGKQRGHLRRGDAHDDKGEEADARGRDRDHRHQPRGADPWKSDKLSETTSPRRNSAPRP